MAEPLIEYKTEKGTRIKFVLIGDKKVGKTSIFNCYFNHKKTENYEPTIGIESKKTIKQDNHGKYFIIKIEDTSGDEKFLNDIKKCFEEANFVLIVFDLTNKESFLSVRNWMNLVGSIDKKDIELILIGNKKDLEQNRKVSTEEGMKFADDNDIDYYHEISAFNEEEVKQIFEEGYKIFIKKVKKNEIIPASPTEITTDMILMNSNKEKKKKKFCCCYIN